MKYWIFLLVAVASEVVGTSFLKTSEGFTKLGPSLAVLVGYSLSFYFLSLTLKAIPVGVAYAVWSGLGIVFISLMGRYVFGQQLDWPAIIGITFILAGVLIMQIFSVTTH
ncbi:MAG: multidrug efflux SMR transporter [Gammaproteobacteria bacterium]|jgi:small multidrug resistance pump|nr:multidrug efflux SMR transporter [Gammaproteobacteria bacterium]MCP4880210.1 multidrug efflux SMR transporter [Gammaproteobacteria bacterium]MDP6165084.1 multidrug efflux SMR transporter [Gammaproteobacteria bacterium]